VVERVDAQPDQPPAQAPPDVADDALRRPAEDHAVRRAEHGGDDDEHGERDDRPGERAPGGECVDDLFRQQQLHEPRGAGEQGEDGPHGERPDVRSRVGEESAHGLILTCGAVTVSGEGRVHLPDEHL
jgi:hypothetical protein